MSTRSIRWFIGELPGLVSDGVLDEATADRRRARHPAPASLRICIFDGQPVREWLAAGGQKQAPTATTTSEP